MWWSNNEQRRHQKELIKTIIKRTKLSEKAAQPLANTPPSLCHSVPTSDTFSDGFARTRGVSLESQFSTENSINAYSQQDLFATSSMISQQFPAFSPFPGFSPYEVDIKTERQMFIDNIPTRKDSTISTFSAYQVPPQSASTVTQENWIQQELFERRESYIEEPVEFNFFDLPHAPLTPGHQLMIQVDECDQHLLNHFTENVLRLIFPILDVNQHGSARDLILPALESNKTYLHCCLSIAALHLKSTEGIQGEQIDNDIMRHRYATISELCEALNRDTDHAQILEATLGMIFFQCSVGRPHDALPDIPWHQHFQAATSLIHKLELPQLLVDSNHAQPPFNMTLAAWIDILGATMVGRPPAFADTYREKNIGHSTAGLAELMGCEDRIMFLISEIACLEALKANGMDEVHLCGHIKTLGDHISGTEHTAPQPASCFSNNGAFRPKQLSANITAVFRLAARIYLCSLVPDFDRQQASITNLVSALADAMAYIPGGESGFDHSVVWPLLVAGAVSTENSSFRMMLAERAMQMGEAAEFGSFGRVCEILNDVWQHNDEAAKRGERQGLHWRDAMKQRDWDFLLI